MQANAKEILLLAAEDAFEFERWRDAGPVTADIDPETRAAEVAEFEALGIPLPSDLDSLRRELEHAPKVREAIRCSAVAMRRSGRASASSLVALGPQQLMHAGASVPWGWPGGPMIDPRLAAHMGFVGGAAPTRRDDDEESRPRNKRERKLADATVVGADGGSIDAQVVGDYDPDDDDDDDLDDLDDDLGDPEAEELARARQREAQRRSKKRRSEARKARAARARDWEDDDLDGDDRDDRDDRDDSMVAVAPVGGAVDRNTWILGGVSAVAVIALLWIAFGDKKEQPDPAAVDAAAVLAAQQQQQQQPAPEPEPVPPQPTIDPNTGLPYGQAPAPVVDAASLPASGGGRGGGGRGSAVRGSGGGAATPVSGAGGGTAFGGFKDVPGPPGTGPAPAGGGTTPAAGGGTQPAANGATQPAANGGAAVVPAPTPTPTPAPQPAADPPVEPPKPAVPEESLLTKSKMTPAIREGVTQRVGDLLACLEDARVGKPDVGGNVVFTVSLDQDGVVTKVDIGKDEVGYGVAKCSAKKMRRWTLPSAGIPIIFDVPFAF